MNSAANRFVICVARRAVDRTDEPCKRRAHGFVVVHDMDDGFDKLAHRCCLVLDVELPGPGGLELQQALRRRGDTMPIIFISAYQDIPKTVRAIKAGASDFLLKPIDTQKLLAAIESALVMSAVSLSTHALTSSIDVTLSERERVVLGGVVAGRLNKQIAADLSLSERTIKSCRADLMRKFGARSLAELIRLTEPALRAAPLSTHLTCPEGQSGCLTPR